MSRVFDWTTQIGAVDVSALIPLGGTIDYGRASVFTGFTAPRAVFTMFSEADYPNYGGTWPTVDIGDAVLISVTWNGTTQWRRFTGTVQALEYSPQGMRVTCVGNAADLATKVCADTYQVLVPNGVPLPAETDLDRIVTYATETATTINVLGTEGRWVTEIPGNTYGTNALETILDMASDCDALFMETRLGDLDYRARVRTRDTRYTLPAAVVERDTIDMVKERGLYFNSVDVYYGDPDPTTGEQSRVYYPDSVSIAAIGERRAEPITTQLRFLVGAEGKARKYLTDHGDQWHAPDVTLLMSMTTDAQADAILALEEGDPVRLSTLPTGAPVASIDCDLIGVTEIMHDRDYLIVAHLSPGSVSASEDDGNWVEDGLITGGNTTGTYTVGSQVWRYHTFTSSGDLTIAAGVDVNARLVAVGGGGGGGGTGTGLTSAGGGGGAGAMYDDPSYLIVSADSPITVTVGTGGTGGNNGADTIVAGSSTVTATGGGEGGYDSSGGGSTGGGSGGSGGGGSGRTYTGGTGTGGTGGNAGCHYYSDGLSGTTATGGNGGGATPGTDGRVSDITGASVRYAVGGRGAGASGTYTGAANTGSGGGGAGGIGGTGSTGTAGVVVFAYPITPGGGTGAAYVYDEDIPYDTAITYEEA